VLVLDGDYHLPAGFDAILTNLVAAGAIPPPIVAFVYNATLLSRMAEMCCNPDMVTYYADELVPWLRQEYGVSDDPARTVVAGASYGGLASAWLAYNRSDVFGNVLSMSGSYWWGLRTAYGADTGPFAFGRDDEAEWLTRQFAAEPVKPIRFWLDAGTLEDQHLPGGTTLLTANRHLRTVLQAKGYEVRYHESAGAHDHASWRRTFPEGLRYLLNRK
jgi:enterochelin esterase-like enzyme